MEVIFIASKNPLALALNRVIVCGDVNMLITEDFDEFSSYLRSRGSNRTVVVLDDENEDVIHKWLWDTLRNSLNSRLPFVVLGYGPRQNFLLAHDAFYEKEPSYIYVQKPFRLWSFLECLCAAKPLNDSGKKDFFKYINPLGKILKDIAENLLMEGHGDFCGLRLILKNASEDQKLEIKNNFLEKAEFINNELLALDEYISNKIHEINECDIPDNSISQKSQAICTLSDFCNSVKTVKESMGKMRPDSIGLLYGAINTCNEKWDRLKISLVKG